MPQSLRSAASPLISSIWEARLSFVGQGLAFLATILPPFFGRFSELGFLVVVSSFAILVAYAGTWSISNIFPSLPEPDDADVALISSVIALFSLFLCAILVLLIFPLSVKTSAVLFWSSAMGLAQGCYTIAIAVAVRDQDYAVIASARLVLGSTSFIATLIACIAAEFQSSLVVVAIISLLTAGLVVAWRKRRYWIASFGRGLQHPVRDWIRYLLHYSSVNAGSFAALSAFNITNIGIIGLGQFSNVWAVVARIAGGFGTTAQFILAPLYEIRFSHSIRERNAFAARQNQRHGLLAGISLGLLATALILCTLWVTGAPRTLSRNEAVIMVLAGSIYVIALLSTAVIAKNVSLAGGKKSYLLWATTKACAGVLALSLLTSSSLLVALVAIEAIFQLLYVIIAQFQLSTLGNQGVIKASAEVDQFD